MPTYLQVALATGLRQTFTYTFAGDATETHIASTSVQGMPQVGVRVRVPFGRSQRVGLVVATTDTTSLDTNKLKPIIEVLDQAPLLPQSLWQLGLWACEYYQCPLGDGMMHLLPANLRQGHGNQPAIRFWQRQNATPEFGRARKQQATWQSLCTLPSEFSDLHLQQAGITQSALKPLLEKDLVFAFTPQVTRPQLQQKTTPLTLNLEQQKAYEVVLAKQDEFSCFLLHGITGSGKTEVYLHLIANCLAQGKRALVLVPEIGLTHQLLERLQTRFHNNLVTLHSGLSNGQRHKAWQLSCMGQGDIVLGTRSAVFTPIPNLGLVIVDEEHDQAFKQQEGFRYHGRDLAVKRAAQEGLPIVLGSATPSLESLGNVARKRYQRLSLTQRAGGAAEQSYEVIDMRDQNVDAGVSERLRDVIAQQLQARHQVLLMLNRRGFAPSLQCHACGETVACHACDANMTLHKQPTRLHCHHCDNRQAVPIVCPSCHGQPMRPLGSGTERIEDWLTETFADVPVIRIDRDSTRKKDALADMIAQVHTGEPCILVGTQMLAKGHHFPHVTAAAVVDADASLFSGDFRGSERLAQLVVQTAGRAGRASKPGKAYIQTYQPEHPVMITLTQSGYDAYAQYELSARRQALLPPYGHIALFLVQAKYEQKAYSLLTWLQQQLHTPELVPLAEGLLHFGPMPALMARRANMYRVQLQLQHGSRSKLQKLCKALCALCEGHPDSKKLRWSLDVDPQDMG